MKESKTAYAYLIEHMEKPSFIKVWDIAYDFVRKLPSELSAELHESLNRGVEVLDTEPLLQMYMYAFGKMHNAKLQLAFSQTGNRLVNERQIQIIDYGCGQGLASLCYHDFLTAHNSEQKITKIVLIEPSSRALSRAELLCSCFYPNADIVAVNKSFDHLNDKDIDVSPEVPTLHIFSNILDIESYNIEHLIRIVSNLKSEKNELVIVSPIVNDVRTQRLKTFATNFNGHIYYENYLGKRQLDEERDWTCSILLCSDRNDQELVVSKCDKIFEEAQSFKDNKNSDWEDENSIKLFRELQICAESGDAKCQNQLGIWYFNGIGTEKDYHCAFKWFQKAAAQQLPDAFAKLAWCYSKGRGVSKDDRIAFNYYQKACDHGLISAYTNLAICYLKGLGCNKNVKNAIGILRYAADYNNIKAHKILGNLYFKGEFIEKNIEQALLHWEYAGKYNDIKALRLLGSYYKNSENKKRNIERAIKYYTKAAKLSDIKSIKILIELFQQSKNLELFCNEQFDAFLLAAKIGIPEISNITNTRENFTETDGLQYACHGLIMTGSPYEMVIEEEIMFIRTIDNETYSIKDGVRVINNGAFLDCHQLRRLEIPASVNFIGANAFRGCYLPDSIKLPNSLVYIGDQALAFVSSNPDYVENKKTQSVIYIPESVQIINGNPFCQNTIIHNNSPRFKVIDNVLYSADGKTLISYCSNSEEFIIPKGVERIGVGAFRHTNIKKVEFPQSLKIIDKYAFSHTCIERFEFPQSLEIIDQFAFSHTWIKAGIIFPKYLKKIKGKAFDFFGVDNIDFTFLSDRTDVDPDAFGTCAYLNLVKVPKGSLSHYRPIFAQCGVNQMIDEDFIFAHNLYLNLDRTEIITTNLESYPEDDNNEDDNHEYVIPEGICKIRDGAFGSLFYIQSIKFPKTLKEFSEEMFNEEVEIKKIYVPIGHKIYFASKLPDFEDIIEEIE